jgi:hypothetical protein
MLLTEITNYSNNELELINFWNKSEWVYWKERPKSIFLVHEVLTISKGKRFKIKECVLEINFSSRIFKFNTCSNPVIFLLKSDLGVDYNSFGFIESNFRSNKLTKITIKLFQNLLDEARSNPKKMKMIEKASFSKTEKKNKKFTLFFLETNNRITAFEKFLNKEKYYW